VSATELGGVADVLREIVEKEVKVKARYNKLGTCQREQGRTMAKWMLALLAHALIALPLCSVRQAATWYVDGSVSASGDGSSWATAFQKIQEGIDAASDGDTVTVKQGTYFENVQFKGKNIVLQSLDPLGPGVVANTIIDGNKAGSVVTFDGTETEACVLSGFTIRNGRGHSGAGIIGGNGDGRTLATVENNVITENWAERHGGGLFRCDGIIRNNTISENSCMLGGPWGGGGLCDCNGTIQNNVITGNRADRGGGLLYCDGEIQDNEITGNSALDYHSEGGGLAWCDGAIRNNTICENSAEGWGGGLFCCDGIIDDNMISGNTATHDGGGLYSCNGTVQNNVVTGNSAEIHGGAFSYCDGVIRGNIITGNSAPFHGGGLHSCDGTIENNLISRNSADLGAGLYECGGTIRNNAVVHNLARRYGGGLFRCNARVSSNTIAANSAGRQGGGLYDCRGTVRNCIIWGNWAEEGSQIYVYGSWEPTHSCIEGWTAGGEGNISEDPRFLDPDGPDDDPETYEDNDYHLAEGSPCIDAGLNEDWMWEAVDLDRRPRILCGVSSLTVDMGAYEYTPKELVRCHPERAELDYATGTFSVPVSVIGFPCALRQTLSAWLVVKDVVFAVSGPDSVGRLWNADGITSEAYPDAGDYHYRDISALVGSDSVETYEVMLEFYIKDRNPSFEPVLELWAFDPVTNSLQNGGEEFSHADRGAGREERVAIDLQRARQSYLRIERVVSVSGGRILIQWTSVEGCVYVVEASGSPMGPWAPVSEQVRSGGDTIEWVDASSGGAMSRFYKVREICQ